jgi:hypothetical protein
MEYPVYISEQRVNTCTAHHRVPAVTVLDRANIREEIITLAPLAVFAVQVRMIACRFL